MKKIIFKILLMILVFPLDIFASESNGPDTLSGYFLFYSYSDRPSGCVRVQYDVIIPLNLTNRKLATDSFNAIISKDNYSDFLQNSQKIYWWSLNYPDKIYLEEKYSFLDFWERKKENKEETEETKENKEFVSIWDEIRKNKAMEYSCNYKNIKTSLILAKADIVVVDMDKRFSTKVCAEIQLKDEIVWYPSYIHNQCKGLVMIDIDVKW